MNLLELIEARIVVFDGGMGSNLPVYAKACGSVIDHDKIPCSELYNVHAPEVVKSVHKAFIEAGCDLVETNTFNANAISLKEHSLEKRVHELNKKAVAIAKEAAKESGQDVLVSGDLGPTSKLPTLGQITFDELHVAYLDQAKVLVDEGVDLIQIDTCQDPLQAKAAVVAVNDYFEEIGRRLPIVLTFTIDENGKMLLGSDASVMLSTFVPLGVDVIGLNCGLGPKGMESVVRELCHNSPIPVAIIPNAGLPEIVDGETSYNLSPEDFSDQISYYVKELGVDIVGGCCGTTPKHLQELASKVKSHKKEKREIKFISKLSSLFASESMKQEPAPLIIGERMNINGSKKFKKSILDGDYDNASLLAIDQEGEGSHLLDISLSYAGRDEKQDFGEVVGRVVQKTRLPISIDSTSVDIIEDALKKIPGRSLINSINLQDGGEAAKKVLSVAKRFGSSVIGLTIDDKGMAKDVGEKIEIAEKIIKLAGEYGIKEEDLFIDLLTFTLAEPRAAAFGSGAKTLEAISRFKEKHPSVNTVLGVSNVSYGFKRSARKVLNSVFLHEAVAAGLDAAIIHSGKIVPISRIEKEAVDLALALIWNRSSDALDNYIKFFETGDAFAEEAKEDMSSEEGVRVSILRGDKSGVVNFLNLLIKEMPPKDILNNVLLKAMAEVGEKFDSGDIPLPFVLQSAEAMRVATDELSKYFGKDETLKKGKLVLATVKGDVHDIGKDLVDIVFSNNGFEVVNLGVKQPVSNIIRAAKEHNADIIGLSGLLVESALIMKDDLLEMSRNGIDIPVICGGAALTEKYVKEELDSVYKGSVFYASDAFDGLKIAKKIDKE